MSIYKDLLSNLSITQVAIPAVKTATVTSSAIDMQGYGALDVLFNVGNSGDTLSGTVYWTLTLQESDDDSTYTTVTDTKYIQAASKGVAVSGTSIVIDAPTEDSGAFELQYIGIKRYVKAIATATGTHTNGTPMGIASLQGNPDIAKVK